jgi:hypothetical protein
MTHSPDRCDSRAIELDLDKARREKVALENRLMDRRTSCLSDKTGKGSGLGSDFGSKCGGRPSPFRVIIDRAYLAPIVFLSPKAVGGVR